MRVAINLEFTDEELKRYATDVGRRVALDAIHEGIVHLNALKLDPSVSNMLAHALVSALTKPQEPPTTEGKSETPPVAPSATQPPPMTPSKHDGPCLRVQADDHFDEGWLCHCCETYNGAARAVCRACAHVRCDVIVTPPPTATDPTIDPNECDWTCGRCGVMNALHRKVCRSCTYEQGKPTPS